jgi:surfactin family lipopeptide synthetase A
LNSQGECCPIGIPGEICISGIGVARGYINKPELTAEKFFDKALSSLLLASRKSGRTKNTLKGRNQPGAFWETRRARNQELRAKIYRSGDQGRWLPDGNIEFIGRVDHQLMIKGHRVEPAEIENILVSHSSVKDAVVCAGVNERDDSYLVAYVVSQDKGLRTQLEMLLLRKVPLYMVPSYFVIVDQLPLNPNGKVDRKALPEPKHESREEYVPPRNDIEQQLTEVWQEVLGVEGIGINHHFFELGGDSIKAIQVSARLYKHRLKLNLRDLFLYPTIIQLAPYIEKTHRQADQGIVQGEVPLTPIQEEFFARHSNHRHHFNLAVMLYREEGFNESIVRKAITKLVEHHDALRMIYPTIGGNVHQINRGMEEELFSLEIINIEDVNNLESRVEIEAQRIQESIDLAAGPLVKTGLFNTPKGSYLLIVIHHLVVDGVSWRIFLEDFTAAYQQAVRGEEIQLPEKTDSFKYWAAKLGESSVIKKFLKELDHWKQIETAETGPIPQGSPIKKEDKIYKNLESVHFNLDPAETGTLLAGVHHAYGTEINDILLTGLGLAVKQWAHINTFLINLEGHGREAIAEDVNINRTIGWFTSQYPVILDIKSSADLSYTIKQVKETLRKIPNKGIGYGILKYAHLVDEKQEPKISFNYLGQFDRESAHNNSPTNRDDSEPFTISPLKSGNAVSPGLETEYDLDIVGMVTGGQLVTSISYNKLQYDRSTMEKLAGYYKESLLEVIHHCRAKKEKELTPSDFTKKDMDMSELEKIMDIVAEI